MPYSKPLLPRCRMRDCNNPPIAPKPGKCPKHPSIQQECDKYGCEYSNEPQRDLCAECKCPQCGGGKPKDMQYCRDCTCVNYGKFDYCSIVREKLCFPKWDKYMMTYIHYKKVCATCRCQECGHETELEGAIYCNMHLRECACGRRMPYGYNSCFACPTKCKVPFCGNKAYREICDDHHKCCSGEYRHKDELCKRCRKCRKCCESLAIYPYNKCVGCHSIYDVFDKKVNGMMYRFDTYEQVRAISAARLQIKADLENHYAHMAPCGAEYIDALATYEKDSACKIQPEDYRAAICAMCSGPKPERHAVCITCYSDKTRSILVRFGYRDKFGNLTYSRVIVNYDESDEEEEN